MRLDQLAGTNITGLVKLSATAANELLGQEGSPVQGATVAFEPDNQVVFRYGVLHARATLREEIDTGTSPRITLVLASVLVAFALGTLVRLPYLQVSGRDVTIAIGDLPALGPLRALWSHVTRARIRAESGALAVEFTVSIKEQP